MLREQCSSESTSWFPYSSAAGVPSKAHFIVILRFWGKWLNKYLSIETVAFLNAKTCGGDTLARRWLVLWSPAWLCWATPIATASFEGSAGEGGRCWAIK